MGQEPIRQFRYDPYGQLLAAEDIGGVPLTSSDINEAWHLFQGRWYDEDTGLIYFRGRWYNPKTGRFLSRDPNGQALALANTNGNE